MSRAGDGEAVAVSVVVPVSNDDYAQLRRQLESLLGQRAGTPFEVVVADNSGDLARRQDVGEEVRVIDASERRGAAYARNRGADEARGDLLLFCDADDVVAPGWVAAHVEALRTSTFTAGAVKHVRHLDAAFVGEDPAGSLEGFTTHPFRHEGVDVAASGNMGVRRGAFERVGGFPEAYLRSQDVALSLRLRQLGVRPAFVSHARVVVAVDGRPLPEELRVRVRKGRARVMLARDFGLPRRASVLAVRGAARLGRAVVHAACRSGPRRSIALEAAESWGICEELLSGAVGRGVGRPAARARGT